MSRQGKEAARLNSLALLACNRRKANQVSPLDSASSVGREATRRVRPSSMASRRMLWSPSLAPRLHPCVSGLSASSTGRTASCLPATRWIVDQCYDSRSLEFKILGPTAAYCFMWGTQNTMCLLQSCCTLLHSCLSSQHQLKQEEHTCFLPAIRHWNGVSRLHSAQQCALHLLLTVLSCNGPAQQQPHSQ